MGLGVEHATEAQVQVIARQVHQQLGGRRLHDEKAQLRPALQHPRHRDRQQLGGERGNDAQADVARRALRQQAQLLRHVAHVGQHDVHVAAHGLAVGRQVHAAPVTLEQLRAQHVLHLLDELGCGGLRHAAGFSGAAQGVAFAHRAEQRQMLEPQARQQRIRGGERVCGHG